MEFVKASGGREKYFKATNVGDCVTRAICNATGKDYLEVYKRLKELSEKESTKRHRGNKKSSVRDGVFKETWKKYLKEIGWKKVSTMKRGDPSRIFLTEDDLPNGVLILQLSKHLTCVKDKVIYDTYNCSVKSYIDSNGDVIVNDKRLIYSYYIAPSEEDIKIMNEEKRIKEEKKAVRLKEKEHKLKDKEKIKDIKSKYNSEISKLKREIRKLERQRDKELEKEGKM